MGLGLELWDLSWGCGVSTGLVRDPWGQCGLVLALLGPVWGRAWCHSCGHGVSVVALGAVSGLGGRS